MAFEVELKFPIQNPEELLQTLTSWGIVSGRLKQQVDRYFNHPSRDFAQTDEALRLRLDAGHPCITYKGPKIDTSTKTRREIEVPIGANQEAGETDLEAMSDLLTALGFRTVATVTKSRTCYDVPWDGGTVELSIDDVERVGFFVELEKQAADSDLDAARESILTLASKLGLSSPERRSYLELLLLGQGP